MIFEDKISEIQKDMLSLALEISEGKVDKLYIYGSHENNTFSFNAFFEKSNVIYSINQLPQIGIQNITSDKMFNFLKIGTDDLKNLISIYKEESRDVPTQIKLVYDNIGKRANANYSYDQFFSNSDTLTPEDIFMKWYEEVKAEVEGKE
ncbi:TPA: hypothetical protein U2B91_001088 [Streptococcus suis]|nr:hypothetical protein [Streptococcus suis]HEM6099440.1 hypothetical protein [Streptococcus suis]